VTFAGVLFLVAAFFNAVYGLAALVEPKHLFVTENGVLISDYDALGIVLLIVAGVQFLVGWGIVARLRAAQVLGIIVAVISAIIQLAYFKAHPAWAVIILVLDAIVIYALTVHGDEFAPAARRR
jgi:hypothetical protein